jgi:hypothetical protein
MRNSRRHGAARTLDEVLAALQGPDGDQAWDAVADRLLPLLPRQRSVRCGVPDPVMRHVPPGLAVTIGIDAGPALLYVNDSVAATWGMTSDEVVDRALANVRQRAERLRRFPLIRESMVGYPLTCFVSHEGWASSLLLMPDLLARVFGDAPGIVFAPTRDVVCRAPIDADWQRARWLLEDLGEPDPNALDVPLLTFVGGALQFALEDASATTHTHSH